MIDRETNENIKSARAFTKNAVEQIMVQTGVTPPIMDLIICEALADIRKYEIHWKPEVPPVRPAEKQEANTLSDVPEENQNG